MNFQYYLEIVSNYKLTKADKELIKNLIENPDKIKDFEDLKEGIQVALVSNDFRNIEHIKNPTIKTQLAAIKQNPSAIRYFVNPSEELQLAAVKRDASAIRYLRNPSEEVKDAVKENIAARP